MSHWARVALATSMALLLGCSSGEPFDPTSVDLQGEWLLSDVTQPQGGLTLQGVTNECRLTDVPFSITADPASETWTANQGEGGTIRCELDGVWGPPAAPLPRLSFVIVRTGGAVQWIVSGRFSYYVGDLTSADRMGGAVDFEGYGRQGTWNARRQS